MNRDTAIGDSSVALETFLDHLDKSRLVDEKRLDDLRRDTQNLSRTIRAPALARRLVKAGVLTEWQQQMLLEGRTAFFLGKYKLLRPLGRGGMGIVFEAEHATMGRSVAIKVLPKQSMKNPAAVARFYQEIQTAAQLHDPHVVVAFDADCMGDTHFLVMEYVEGEDLQSVMDRRGKFFPEEACEYVRQAALGLQHAHEKGLVHRDIKPSNLMLTFSSRKEPVVKILDMGLAKFVKDVEAQSQPASDGDEDRNDGLTRAGQVMGTPDYMAPEQAWNLRSADIRSDIYSLGCTLFEFLTGRLPYCGESTTQKVLARSVLDAPSARAFDPHISAELDAVVARMLARDPQDRFQTPAELAEALEPLCAIPLESMSVVQEQGPAPAEQRSGAERSADPRDRGLEQFLNELADQVDADLLARPRKTISRRTTVFDAPSDEIKQYLRELSPDADGRSPADVLTADANVSPTDASRDVGDLIEDCLTQRPTEETLLRRVERRNLAERTNLLQFLLGLIVFLITLLAVYRWLV